MSNEFELKINEYTSVVAILQQKAHHSELSELTEHEKGLESYGTGAFHLCRRSYSQNREVGNDTQIGSFSLSPMPGCCGIVVVHGMYLNSLNRGGYLSDSVRKLKVELCKALGYTVMMATTRMDEIPAVGNFFKSKYKFVDTFTNKRTNHLVGIGVKKI